MRSVANTTLSLGLVNAPVKIYPATHDSDIHLNLVAPDGAAVEQVYRNTATGDVIGSSSACMRAFEGRIVDTDDLSLIDEECSHEDGVNLKKTLAIRKFIPLSRVPFNRVTKWYYLAPDGKQDMTAYVTLVQAMRAKNCGAVCKVMLRNRQRMMIVYAEGDALYGVILTYATDLNPLPEECEQAQQIEVNPQFLNVAEQIIDATWDDEAEDISTMTDSALDKRRALIASVMAGEKVTTTEAPEPQPPGADLLAALQASLDQIKPNGKVKAKVRRKATA